MAKTKSSLGSPLLKMVQRRRPKRPAALARANRRLRARLSRLNQRLLLLPRQNPLHRSRRAIKVQASQPSQVSHDDDRDDDGDEVVAETLAAKTVTE